MLEFLNKPYPVKIDLKDRLKEALWIGIGVFLFILFFQPFEIEQTNLNNYILLIAGFGAITFILQNLIHIALPMGRTSTESSQYSLKLLVFFEILLWVLNSVAFAFYLRYVGEVQLSIFIVFRIVLISLFPSVVNLIVYEIHSFRVQLAQTESSDKKPIEQNALVQEDVFIELISDTRSDKFKLNLNSLILVKAAENYVEIHYEDHEKMQKKLIRATLKNIEDQIQSHSFIVRCHRNCIVNILKVEKLKRTPQGFRLKMRNYEDEIAVSRQYLLFIRNALV